MAGQGHPCSEIMALAMPKVLAKGQVAEPSGASKEMLTSRGRPPGLAPKTLRSPPAGHPTQGRGPHLAGGGVQGKATSIPSQGGFGQRLAQKKQAGCVAGWINEF